MCVGAFFVAMKEHPEIYTSEFNWHLSPLLQRKTTYS
jgi:hypothetical protein